MPARRRIGWDQRAILVVGVLVAVGLLTWGVTSGAAHSRYRAQRELDAAARADATDRAKAIDDYFARARSVLLLAAQNPAFRDFYDGTGTSAASADRDAALTDAVAQMRYLHSLYPDSVGEICFIDRRGGENARLVGGVAAAVGALSPDERGNPFFGPTLQVPVGQVLQASPYRSPDTHDLVISNSTPLVGRSGAVTAMLHYEVSVDSFGALVARAGGPRRARLVDLASGTVVADTARASTVDSGAEVPYDVGAVAAAVPGASGVATVAGRRVALVRLAVTHYNENRWAVVLDVPHASPQMGGLLNATTLTLVLVAGALLTLAYLGARARRLHVAAHTDPLTGLPNRRAFLAEADRAMHQAARAGSIVAVALVDLDRFKEVNDALGHAAGDTLLQILSERLAKTVSAPDRVARLGGDEFAVLFTSIMTAADAVEEARRIAGVLGQPVRVHDVTFSLEASIGIALPDPDRGDTTVLLQHADAAMYEAKHHHSGPVLFGPHLDVQRPERLALLNELRTAIEEHALSVHYQPKVDLRTGAVVGVEALARWHHPRLGLVMPDDFVDLAERSSLIAPLTRLVLAQALAENRRWADAGCELSVAVNVSPRSLRDIEFVGTVVDALERSGVPAHRLVLELTESAIMTDPHTAGLVLGQLHACGVQLSVDDFGTGYSSLAYLQSLPLDELKIDRSFVARLDDTSGRSIVTSVVDLARNLGLRVVAEGVETAEGVELLRSMRCDVGQGYLWCRALPAAELDVWLTRRLAAPAVDAVSV